MSHYHLEIIMPRTADISKSIEEIMLPFSENEEENEDHSGHSFWDFYVIGGRWAGAKERCTYNTNALEQFNALLSCDISRVDEIPENLKCARVIIAGPDYSDKKFKAQHMLCESIWNGVNHVKTTWNGNVLSAISEWQERIKEYKEEYAKKHTVQPDWLCITIDYHS
jgi:hypothetical protein